MPRKPTVFLSDEAVIPEDVLPAKAGDPETENPYNPLGPPKDVPPEPENPPPPLEPEPEPEENPPAAGPPPKVGSEYSAPVGDPSSPTPLVTYRSRISVLQAWRYPGQLSQAPDFIDRSWTAWQDADLQGRPAGPALKVPVTRTISGPTPPDGFKFCRIGDYVVRQNVSLVDGLEPEEHLDVWPKDDFERLFMPVKQRTPLTQWTDHADAA